MSLPALLARKGDIAKHLYRKQATGTRSYHFSRLGSADLTLAQTQPYGSCDVYGPCRPAQPYNPPEFKKSPPVLTDGLTTVTSCCPAPPHFPKRRVGQRQRLLCWCWCRRCWFVCSRRRRLRHWRFVHICVFLLELLAMLFPFG